MKILVVDDEALARERLLRLLGKLQPEAQCLQADSGEEALALVEQCAPDLLLLDIRMPGMDGMDVLRKIKHEHPITEVIIYTGHGGDVEKELSRELGVFAYLQKPVDIGVLIDTMKAAYKKMKRVSEI